MARTFEPRGLLAALLVAVGVALGGCGSHRPAAGARYPLVSVSVGSRPISRTLAPGFVGLSFEYTAVGAYANPFAIGMIRNLSPQQRPVLRIGGNSTDETWWPQPGQPTPRGAIFPLTSGWLRRTEEFAAALDARMIMGLNLAADRPPVARAEADALERGIGPRYIEYFEIGNEPDLYGLFPWPQDRGHLRRPASYSLTDYIREFSRWREAIGPELPVAGPAYATFDWSLGRFIDAEPGLAEVTFHHYALDACLTKPSARGYPTIRSLLSDQSSRGLARELAPAVAVAHNHHLRFRLDELGSASCGGKQGVSNTFASALWMLDTLFNLASVGVDGVNIHTFPGAAYAAFSGTSVYPEYYGMLMFTRAFPPGARLLSVSVRGAAPLKAWATRGASATTKIVLINTDPTRTYQVKLRVPGLSGRVRLQRLRAPSVSATGGVTIGHPETARGNAITVAPASAVLVTS